MLEYAEWDPGKRRATRMFLSPRAKKGLDRHADVEFLPKLERWLQEGLWTYEGKRFPLRHEGNGVYRIATPSSLLRLIGFFENGNMKGGDFIVPIADKKRGQKTPQPWLKEVRRVRDDHDWSKKA